MKPTLDLETTPLEIKTDSLAGSLDKVDVRFYTDQGDGAGGFMLYFAAVIKYKINKCSTSWTRFPADLPTTTVEKVWKITLDKTSGVRLKIHCNNDEVLDTMVSGSTCSDSTWSNTWSRDVAAIQFHPDDGASDFYKSYQPGTVVFHSSLNFIMFHSDSEHRPFFVF